MDLMKQWLELLARYGFEGPFGAAWFEKLHKAYISSGRHYHNLDHIENLLAFIDQYEAQLFDPDALRLAIWFHDAVYNVFKSNNEVQSAELAAKALTELGISQEVIDKVHRYIVATDHRIPIAQEDTDLAFLVDIDLSILAIELEDYKTYTEQIRREYRVFPNFIYHRGRRKVLQGLLNKTAIYHSPRFNEEWEPRARKNLQRELESL
ncbi:hypothetical protein BH09BAC1_BH09BAC1_21560 [soil metagenome]